MRFKASSDDDAEYPRPGMLSEQDIKMSHCTTRQYWDQQNGEQEHKAWNKSWKQRHPEWFPDKDGLPWDEYWKRFWSKEIFRKMEVE